MNRSIHIGELGIHALVVCIPVFLLGCSSGVNDELLTYIDEVKAKPGGRVEGLPQIKPYESFIYVADKIRSPFMPDRPDSPQSMTGPKPIQDRNKEYLEQFPLDTLAMVGTLSREGTTFGLVQTQDGMVHRVTPGNYIGQNEGRIIVVNDAAIGLEELVPNGIGSFYKRSAEIGLK
ncbi:MAG: pilus assembly protein PilP [Gammaproteobacteria bacterium]|nr:pilus assembly protein PilP [Gammaproteobacteria bacterium]MCP4089947.1 pilus assembly protein PilP [Gammaproteobacteria bacterium]MCP4276278.1 pilus assembly protein PilP [Gammaproteobacteria bacterium]MCP4831273.1 pilus assembly protein PilP [Gammaproteobacteria bacterium]MCP4928756.1 pilus assembly protein PilP [Gammaproteobacteria bacterium]